MSPQPNLRELVKQVAQGVLSAADELRGAIHEDNVPRIRASNDRLQMRVEALKTELMILHRLAPDQEA